MPQALVARGFIGPTVPDFVSLIAEYGPALAAIFMTGVIGSCGGPRRLGERLCRWRVGLRWCAVALFVPAAMSFTALGLHLLFGGALCNPTDVPSLQGVPTGASIWVKALQLALMFTLGFDGSGEELGWRGFGLPRLLERFPALGASVVLAAL